MKVVVRTIIAITMFLSTQILFAQVKLDFKSLADMTSERYGMGYTTDGKNVYAVCGNTSGLVYLSNSIERYDSENNKWTVLSEDFKPKRYCNAEYIKSENKIFVFNGEYFTSNFRELFDRMEIFDLNTNQISFGPNNPYPVKHAGSAVWNNKIYFFGGRTMSMIGGKIMNTYSNRFYEYDPVKSEWKRLPDLLEAKETSGKIIDGILYIFGGYDGSQLRSIDAYNFENSTWTRIGTLQYDVSANATASDGQNIWLVGSYQNMNFIAAYNTKSKSMTKYESTMTDRRHAGAQNIGNLLYVFGGTQDEQSVSSLSTTEVVDISFIKK